MNWVCVCSDFGPNIFLDAYDIQDKNVKQIKKQVQEQLGRHGDLFINTPNFSACLGDFDLPLDFFPQLKVKEKDVNRFKRPEYNFFYSKNADVDTLYIFITFNHTTKYKIPKMSAPVKIDQIDKITFGELLSILSEVSKLEFNAQQVRVGGKIVSLSQKISNFINFRNFPKFEIDVTFHDNAFKIIQHRNNIIREIIDTEEQYVRDLENINHFWAPEIKRKNLMSQAEFDLVFKEYIMIYDCHKKFYDNISSRFSDFETCMAPLFLEFADLFNVSNKLIEMYPKINNLLNIKNQNRGFSSALLELQNAIDGRDLASYLITPVQRMPRYMLFLRELIKGTPKAHPDHILLGYALEKIVETNNNAENQSERAKQQTRLYKLQEKLKRSSISIVKSSRKILKTYNVILTFLKKESKATLYLCNDQVIIIKDHGRFATLALFAPVISFHYLPIFGDYRSIMITTYYKGRRDMKLTFQTSEERYNFFAYLEKEQLSQLKNIGENRYIVWNLDSISENIQPLCEMACFSIQNFVVFYGGTAGMQRNISTSFFSFSNLETNGMSLSCMKTINTAYHGRKMHTLVYHNDDIFCIGGLDQENKECTAIMKIHLKTGQTIHFSPRFQLNRYGHTSVSYENDIYVYGGQSKKMEFFSDVIHINIAQNLTEVIKVEGDVPPARSDHSAVVFHHKMYIFGGRNKSGILRDLWGFDLKKFTWTKINTSKPLKPRMKHKAYLLENEMLIIGGVTETSKPANSPEPPISESCIVDLITHQVHKVIDVGNVPYLLKDFGGGQLSKTEFVIYGGIESQFPLSNLYRIKISPAWAKTLANTVNAQKKNNKFAPSSDEWKKYTEKTENYVTISHRSHYSPTSKTQLRKSKKSKKKIHQLTKSSIIFNGYQNSPEYRKSHNLSREMISFQSGQWLFDSNAILPQKLTEKKQNRKSVWSPHTCKSPNFPESKNNQGNDDESENRIGLGEFAPSGKKQATIIPNVLERNKKRVEGRKQKPTQVWTPKPKKRD